MTATCQAAGPHQPHNVWNPDTQRTGFCRGSFDRPTLAEACERVAAWLHADNQVVPRLDVVDVYDGTVLSRADIVALLAAAGWSDLPDEPAASEPSTDVDMFAGGAS